MRPGQHNKRGRNRNRRHSGGGGNSGGGNPLNRVYESNGPDVKVRGTAQTVADKYLQLGRDAMASGDIVMSESYFQHAEHYQRILAAAQAYNQQFQQQTRRPNGEDGDDDDDGDYAAEGEGDDTQPTVLERPAQQSMHSETNSEVSAFEGERPSQQPQGQQNFRGRERGSDRFRPRFDHNRERQEQNRESENQASVDRNEEVQPRPEPAAAAADTSQAGASGSWEAPSFLKRGSANGSGTEGGRGRYPRRPRREPAEGAEPSPERRPTRETPTD
jgi:hypothetical protein